VHVRFRFYKSSTNFTIRKYKQGQGFLCPVRAARSILRRASTLKVPTGNPVGAFRTHPSGSFTYLRSADVIKVMRMSVDFAYPDLNHYFRLNRAAFVAHSNCVTAAVALYANGRPIPEIAFRLRWKPESVEHYIRECSQMVYKHKTLPSSVTLVERPVRAFAPRKGHPPMDTPPSGAGTWQLATPGKLGSTISPAAPSSHQGLLLNNQ